MDRQPPHNKTRRMGGRLLPQALAANAVFSGASGAVALAAAPTVALALGEVPPTLVRLVGAGLVAFAAFVAWQSRAPRPALVRAIVAADVAWVAGSALLVAFGSAWLSFSGTRLVLALAAVVALFAVLQAVGLRRADVHAPPAASVTVVLHVVAPPADVWRIVGQGWVDVHKLLPRIAHSRLLSHDLPCLGATRECTLASPVMGMSEIRERLVAWDPPRGFTYELAEPPFPMARLRNTWRIEADGAGTRLTLTPELELRGGRLTRGLRGLVLRALMRELDRDVAQLRSAIEREALAGEMARA